MVKKVLSTSTVKEKHPWVIILEKDEFGYLFVN